MDERNDYASLALLDQLPFTDDELIEMASRQYPNSLWQKAFNFYNEYNPKLSMSCRSCYGKVIAYLLTKRLSS